MNDNEIIRVLIVDDHDAVREGLTAILSRQNMQVIAQAADGYEAVALYRQCRPDITLMDIRMPQMDGLTATRAITSEFPEARVIVLTTFEGEEENSRQAGAKAIILKDAPRRELVETIHRVYCAT